MSNDVDMEADNIPPGRVTDLHVENLDHMVAVHFTAPGDDLDSDDKADEYIVKFSSTVGNLTGGNFDKDEFNTVITDKDLVNDSTLEPENGGTQKTFFIKDSLFTVGEKSTKTSPAPPQTSECSHTSWRTLRSRAVGSTQFLPGRISLRFLSRSSPSPATQAQIR